MIVYYPGTVFNVDAEAIVNTINCDGVMGAGIALEFGLRYPNMYQDYLKKCEQGQTRVGKVDYYKESEELLIVNFPTKVHFKFPSRMQWIELGLQDFSNTYKELGIKKIAFPKLGTSRGGLEWNEVRPLMERYLEPLDIEVVICLDEKKEAEGVEARMLELFNASTISSLSKIARLNEKQRNAIETAIPFKRFWAIAKIEGVGKTTYEKFFKYFYEKATTTQLVTEQLSFSFTE